MAKGLGKKKKKKFKIGKNDPCPCGSGIKYKKCCMKQASSSLSITTPPFNSSPTITAIPLNEIATINDIPMDPAFLLEMMEKFSLEAEKGIEGLKTEFENYNQFNLITLLGSIQLLPENHSKIFSLEAVSRIVCSCNDSRNEAISAHKFDKIINEYLPANGFIRSQEDPVEDVFTDNIIFFGGNYVVYTGISHNETFILDNFLNTIFSNREKFPKHFVEYIQAASFFILSLINRVANRMGHFRYMISSDRPRDNIKIPENGIKILQKLVLFTKKEIEDLLKQFGIDYNFISKFIISSLLVSPRHEDFKKILKAEQPWERNPLKISPLININDEIIIGIPGSITTALRHFIIINSHDFGVNKLLVDNYKEYLWKKVEMYLKSMSFEEIDFELDPWDLGSSIKEGVFKIDTDKLAYVQLITDDLSDYDRNDAYGTFKIDNLENKMSERFKKVVRSLTEKDELNCQKVLIITIFGESGRYTIAGISKLPENTQLVAMNLEELNVITSTHECDNLTLWKYATAISNLLKTTEVMSFSFLDRYACYVDNNHSFNTDKKINGIQIASDWGTPLRIKTKRMWDNHAALHYTNHFLPVLRLNGDESIPIYFIEIGSEVFELLVEGYNQPIWINSKSKINEIPPELHEIYMKINETIAYWLWQITPNFKPHLENLMYSPVSITFDLEKPELWTDINRKIPADELKLDFKKEVDGLNIEFIIPYDITTLLLSYNNEGERIIVDELMQSFGRLLDDHNLFNNLNEIERERILNIHAPIGIKKKISILNHEIIPLDTQNLIPLRELQEHDIEEQLDGLVDDLGDKSLHVGEIINKTDKTSLCNKIVSFYNKKLSQMISKYDWKLLLEKLMGYNEAVIHERTTNAIFIGPSIECYSDIQSRVEKDFKKISKLQSTFLSLRSLIEKVTAEPPMGNQEISMDEYDKILAIMSHIVKWAMLSDDIHLDLYNIKMSILENGRVGVNKDEIEGIWDPFNLSKTLENTEAAIKSFKSYFDVEVNKSNISKDLEEAFEAEFGFNLTKIIDFLDSLISIAYEQNKAVACLHISELRERLKTDLKLDNTQIDKLIGIFSLNKREKWLDAPDGYEDIDVWPWRYNRPLSYLRRPLIIGPEPEENPFVLWGPKHVYETGRYLFDLVMSGRYEGISDKMSSIRGDIVRKRGDEFTENVKNWFEENSSLKIEDEVPIAPGKQLDSSENLGDIDILAIDEDKKIIFSIECKHVNFARNPREVDHEIVTIMKDSKKKKSWITKHSKRDNWLKDNVEKVSKAFDLSSDSFQIFSVILTAHEIPTTYIHDLSLPFISFTKLKREGLIALYSILGLKHKFIKNKWIEANTSEKIVNNICKDSFLSFWSFPNSIRTDNNKELTDLLIVNDPYVIIISVKEINITPSGNKEIDIQRWQKKAIEKSYKQIYGAERAIRNSHTDILTSDKKYEIKFPDPDKMKVYRVGISFGRKEPFPLPFGDQGKGFVHFFDQQSFPVLLNELDTITDFVNYLVAKEKFYDSGKNAYFNSEEDLLAIYLHRGRNFPENIDNTLIQENSWEELIQKDEFKNRKQQEKKSKFWDAFIEEFFRDMSQEQLLFTNDFHEVEQGLRAMSKESRFDRMMLADTFIDFIGVYGEPKAEARISQSTSGVTYVFLLDEYRENERELRKMELVLRCFAARNVLRQNKEVVGIATNRYVKGDGHAYDFCYLYLPEWTEEDIEKYTQMQKELGYFVSPEYKMKHYDEYPK